MPSRARVEALIAAVEKGRFVEAIEEFYAESASMQENGEPPRAPRTRLVENEQRVIAAFARIEARCVRPFLVDGDDVVIHWQFAFTAADGSMKRLDELALQHWDDDRIATERFFYDPAQMR
ncbi:MAG TPA: nuclear transport factor 2 family protein [Myxococcota bacterium]|nr:nuclear transport factor 2 family protein [Myxococcota bacterium]